jgi:hypothetical protein
LDEYRFLVLTVGDFAQADEFLLGHVGCALALLWEDTVCCTVTGTFAEVDSWDCGALGDDLVGAEVLVLLGQFF